MGHKTPLVTKPEAEAAELLARIKKEREPTMIVRTGIAAALKMVDERPFMVSGREIQVPTMEVAASINAHDPAHEKHTSINGSGRITFSFDGRLAAQPSYAIYAHTNESYSARCLDAMGTASGINRYIGVLGGADQHYPLIGALQRGNRLDDITLVDINPNQIIAAAMIFSVYNRSNGDADAHPEIRFWEGFNSREVKMDDITVTIKNQEVRDALTKAAKGKYFIYLSNTISVPTSSSGYGGVGGGWGNQADGRAMLNYIQTNPKIEDGSLVLVASPSSSNLLMRKVDGRLRVEVLDSVSREEQAFLEKYLDALGDLRKADREGGNVQEMLRRLDPNAPAGKPNANQLLKAAMMHRNEPTVGMGF